MRPALKYLLLFTFLSPGMWQVASHFPAAITAWQHIPASITPNIRSKLSVPYTTYIDEMRWGGRFLHRNDLLSRLLYLRASFLVNEAFDFVQFATPRLYFAVGDGSHFSPARIEPVPVLLFPFWLFGLIQIVKTCNWRVFILLFISLLPAYLSGHKNLALLFPAVIVHIYISVLGLVSCRPPIRTVFGSLVSIYGLYIVAMNLWFNSLVV